MKKINFFVILLIITTLPVSCKKYLDKKVNTSVVVPSTIRDLQALLDNYTVINVATPMFVEASADDYFILEGRYNNYGISINSLTYIWGKPEYNHSNDWNRSYLPVFYTNLCLERIEDVPKASTNLSDWNNVKGTALFLRSYYFSWLAWTFAKAYDVETAKTDLGIVLRLGSDFNVLSVRSSVEDTYNRIIADAKESIAYLPEKPVHVARPSKVAAYGLLSRVYLSMRNYDSAYKYADLCLALNSELMDYNNPGDVAINTNSPFQQFNKEVIFHTEWVGSFLNVTAPGIAFIDTTLYQSYEANDLRKTALFVPQGDYQIAKNGYSGVARRFTGIATDEIYLVKAECLARLNETEAAMNLLNTLLSKRIESASFVPVVAENAQAALEVILSERRKELTYRSLRWMDIKRLNKENRNIIPTRFLNGEYITLPPNDSRYALPLPRDIIALTGMPQN